MDKIPVIDDGLCECQHCGYKGIASDFYRDIKYNFIFCNDLQRCWERLDRKNGMTEWQAKQNRGENEQPK